MKNKRKIEIKNPRLQRVRNSLRNLIIEATSARRMEMRTRMKELETSNNGTRRTIRDFTPDELKEYRALQQQESRLGQYLRQSICFCMTCQSRDRDMVYIKSHYSWYCTECYSGQRDYAKELFQTIGKTKPEGHEEKAIHEHYETFLDYEESHEIELKLVREGILIYLLKLHNPLDVLSYGVLMELLERAQKPIKFVLKSLKEEKFIELGSSSDKFKVSLTQQGEKEAKSLLNKVKGVESYKDYFFNSLENFKHFNAIQSDLYESTYPWIFEKMVNGLKAEKASSEEINLKIDEFKESFGYFYES